MRSAISRIASLIGVFIGRCSLKRHSFHRPSSLYTSNSCRLARFLCRKKTPSELKLNRQSPFDLLEIVFNCVAGGSGCLWIDAVELNDQTTTRSTGVQRLVKREIEIGRWNGCVGCYLIVFRQGLIDDKVRRRHDGKSQTSSDSV